MHIPWMTAVNPRDSLLTKVLAAGKNETINLDARYHSMCVTSVDEFATLSLLELTCRQ